MREQPKYSQLFEQLKTDILSGVYTSGQKIPGENEIARDYNMSRQTVRQAMALLEQEGLVERRQGSGTYVTHRNPRKKKTWNVGVVATYIGEYIFPSILRGIEGELSEAGFSPVLAATKNRVDNERRILADFLNKPIDGLIIEGTKTALPNPNIDLYEEINKRNIPVVFFNSCYPVLKEENVCIAMNDRKGGHDAVKHLLSRGHTQIGGIFKSDDMQGLDRYAGYLNAIMENKLPMKDEWVVWFNSESRSHLLSEETDWIFSALKECTAIVCYNDEIAVKLINSLNEKSVSVPKEKAIISFDNSLYSQVSQVPITSLDHSKEILGAVTARQLVGMMDGKAGKSLTLDWGLSQKDST